MRTSILLSLLYNFLIKSYRFRKTFGLSFIWFRLWRINSRLSKSLVRTNFNGQKVLIPNGHWYLLICLKFPNFNRPLLVAVDYLISKRKRSLGIIDIGAAVGDTVILLESNFQENKNYYFCFDGDEEYCQLQGENLSYISSRVEINQVLLSDKNEFVRSIEKSDPTTGMSIGENLVYANTLDDFFDSSFIKREIDLIKVDVDGFDGRIIAGARKTISIFKPLILFEWNVPLYHMVGSDIFQPFDVLESMGYDKYIWFNNEGEFSFVTAGIDKDCLSEIANFLMESHSNRGIHFDVLAFSKNNLNANEFLKRFSDYKNKSTVI